MLIIKQMDQIRRETVTLSYIIGQLTAKLVEGQTILRQTRRNWFQGKMTESFFQFLELQVTCDDKHCPMEYAIPHNCRLSSNHQKLNMQLIIPSIVSNRTAYVADPFTMAIERKGKVCIVKYTGTDILIQEGNCTMPGHTATNHHNGFISMPVKPCEIESTLLDEKINSHNIESCVDESEFNWNSLIQVKFTDDVYWVYCPNKHITLGTGSSQTTHKCPMDARWLRSQQKGEAPDRLPAAPPPP